MDLENRDLLGAYHSAGLHENEGKLQRVISLTGQQIVLKDNENASDLRSALVSLKNKFPGIAVSCR